MRTKIYRFQVALSVLMMVLLSACIGNNDSAGSPELTGKLPETPKLGKMVSFESEDELELYVKTQFAETPLPFEAYTSATPGRLVDDSLSASEGAIAGVAANEASDTNRFSENNTQEVGVDESDKTRTDGRYLYIAQSSGVKIVDTAAEKGMALVARVKVEGNVDALYLHKTQLIILYTPDNGQGIAFPFEGGISSQALIGLPGCPTMLAQLGIRIVDVSDPESPNLRNT